MDVSISSSFLSDVSKRTVIVLIDKFFFIRLAKEMLSYRIALSDAAAYNARLFGYEGWRYLINYIYIFFLL